MIRVLIVDDQELIRGGFRMIIEAQSDLEVVGESADGDAAIADAQRLHPDVVLMDVRMPGLDGIEATRRILDSTGGAPRVLMLTTFDHDEYVYGAIRAGASGFLLKDVSPSRLVESIRAAAAGESLLAPAITRRLLERFVRMPLPGERPPERLAALTPRELEVLELVGQGLSNAEIGRRIFVSDATVKTHVTRILAKLELRDRVQAVVLAYETGLVQPGG